MRAGEAEYRGYDSAGIAIHNGDLRIFKSEGNISNLKRQLPADFHGTSGIAHTRWATHGEANVQCSPACLFLR
ncbi:MAG: hypothetical protein R2727_10240 [Bacteroidales bacterium]